ncbi:ubiquinol-cytochrome C chaperone family protein [Thalassobaculum sp. OXR-137]|uniref:ubiquinol-cytochrome C chaperone family protein n=1 Tax=Thalassobaculum sp. OXR-137 TaxID=3100173 RepID=UPI002AC97178|nr:ubiquinol-cytochrome C chaperone family protein [Thalassobaculum sp. OXR-137]WPZ33266.1 ubiquinol-cytochrome C chaperone family protein [Thalassobaculum sp. OXR-137]
MPAFYADFEVADQLEGRFDLLVLHLHLVIRRLSATDDPAARKIAQALFDTFFHDMDRTLRAMGVGDMSVGKKVKDMVRAYYGRCAAYEEALTGEGDLAEAIRRNVYEGAQHAPQAPALAAYVLRARDGIDALPLDALKRGAVSFPAPSADDHAAAPAEEKR